MRWRLFRGGDLSQEERDAVLERFQVMYRTRDIYKLYREFLEQNHLGTLPDVPLEKRYIQYEDVYPLLYLKYRLLGARQHQDIKHLVVDEMQDYSYLQFLIIKMLFSCRMTILGDRAQIMDGGQQDAFAFCRGFWQGYSAYPHEQELPQYCGDCGICKPPGGNPGYGGFLPPWGSGSGKKRPEPWAGAGGNCRFLMSASYETAAVIFLTEKEAGREQSFCGRYF